MPRLRLDSRQRFLFTSALVALLAGTIMRLFAAEFRFLAYLDHYVFASMLCGLSVGAANSALKRFHVRERSWMPRFLLLLLAMLILHPFPFREMSLMRDTTTYFLFPEFQSNYVVHETTIFAFLFACFYMAGYCFVPMGQALGSLAQILDKRLPVPLFFAGSALGWALFWLALTLEGSPALLCALLGALYLIQYGRRVYNIVPTVAALCISIVFTLPSGSFQAVKDLPAGRQMLQNIWVPDGHVETYPLIVDDKVLGFYVSLNRNLAAIISDIPERPVLPRARGPRRDAVSAYALKYFELPNKVVPHPRDVLIVGGAAGNEAAIALRQGAESVTVVDARDWLFKLSQDHPWKPFQSPRVRRIVMDPRQYLKTATGQHDLIVFAAMEGFGSYSPLSFLRTDNYEYCAEAFADTRNLLSPDGYLIVSFQPVRNWYMNRLAHNLKLSFSTIDALVRTGTRDYLVVSRAQNRLLSALLLQNMEAAEVGNVEKMMQECTGILPTVDDWPFQHVVSPGLPRAYLLTMILMLAVFLVHLRALIKPGTVGMGQPKAGGPPDWRLILLGSALMVSWAKASMTIGFTLGLTSGSAIFGLAATAFASALPGLFYLLGMRLPVFFLWLVMIASYTIDANFNYEAVVSIQNPLLAALASVGIPLMPAFATSALAMRTFTASRVPDLAFGCLIFGLVLGSVFAFTCLVTAVPSLDWQAMWLCLFALLIRMPKRPAPAPEAAPA